MATTKKANKKDTKLDVGAEKVKELDNAIVFKATKVLTKAEFDLLSDMIKSEQKKTGLKIVLMPYSCEVGET